MDGRLWGPAALFIEGFPPVRLTRQFVGSTQYEMTTAESGLF